MYLWWSLCTSYLHACQVRVTLRYIFQVLVNSLVCWFCTYTLGFVLFQIVSDTENTPPPPPLPFAGWMRLRMARSFLTNTWQKIKAVASWTKTKREVNSVPVCDTEPKESLLAEWGLKWLGCSLCLAENRLLRKATVTNGMHFKDLKYWGAWDTTCRHKASDISPSIQKGYR